MVEFWDEVPLVVPEIVKVIALNFATKLMYCGVKSTGVPDVVEKVEVQEKVEAVLVELWELVELEEELVEVEVCVLVELEEDDDVEVCVEAELEEDEEVEWLELELPLPEFIERKR